MWPWKSQRQYGLTDKDAWAIKLTFLGWRGAFPRQGEACSGILVQSREGSFLLDCGCGTLQKLYEFADVSKLEGVVLSHLHFDHMSDLGCLLYEVNNNLRTGKRKEKLLVYSPETPEAVRASIEYPFSITASLRDNMKFTMAGIDISVMKVNHTIECYAFRLEREGKALVYLTDTAYFPGARDFVLKADLLICEATITKDSSHSTGAGHMSDREAGITAREGEVKRLCLYHLPSDGDPDYMRKQAALEFAGEVHTPDMQRIYYI